MSELKESLILIVKQLNILNRLNISLTVPNTATTTASSFVWQEKKESLL
jgi:hypothetical protein